MKKFIIYWLPVLAYAALIFFLSSRPRMPEVISLPFMDKFAHFIEYAIFSLLIARALKGTKNNWRFNLKIIAIIFAIFYAFFDEVHQSFVPGREMDSLDLLCDGLGATAAQFLRR
ncbi:MAG: VanZ family protein [Candidatus Omnitrophota bacterium]